MDFQVLFRLENFSGNIDIATNEKLLSGEKQPLIKAMQSSYKLKTKVMEPTQRLQIDNFFKTLKRAH